MSLPSFPGGTRPSPSAAGPLPSSGRGGAGDHLPGALLWTCGLCTLFATGLSVMSIVLQLKNYRMPALQRCVVRIMVMVPLYALSSFIALYSLNAAFFIDAIRDLYEGFVIYTFLQLLITYLGGERDLLLRLRGRPPIPHTFPVNIFLRPMDPSDPWTLLNLKREYVQVKPILVLATTIFKATGTYHEGEFKVTSGYTYVSIVYNISICTSLYCLAMFWVAVSKDLKPFRPVPKFLCVKGILFFSFWQGILIGFLVSVGAIKRVGPYHDPEHMTLALVDSMICIEMPFFAVAHQYAFQASDYIDTTVIHVARLPFLYAFRDSFGFKDVWEDAKYTFRARGVSYKAYEAADGGLHYGEGRQKRIRAGLRYSKGGQAKYWIPAPDERAALLPKNDDRVAYRGEYDSSDSELSDAPSLAFSDASEGEDALYARARRVGYAGFPNVDITREQARRKRRHYEDGILAGRRWRSGTASQRRDVEAGPSTPPLPQRRSLRNLRRGGSSKGKGKAVYGAWAERAAQSNNFAEPLRPEETEDAPFDGEVENPDAWRPEEDEGGLSLKWTKKFVSAIPPIPDFLTDSQRPRTPEPEPASPADMRSDAVDLVSEAAAEQQRTESALASGPPSPVTQMAPPIAAAPEPGQVTVEQITSPHDEEPGATLDMLIQSGPAPIPEQEPRAPAALPERDFTSAPPFIERPDKELRNPPAAFPPKPLTPPPEVEAEAMSSGIIAPTPRPANGSVTATSNGDVPILHPTPVPAMTAPAVSGPVVLESQPNIAKLEEVAEHLTESSGEQLAKDVEQELSEEPQRKRDNKPERSNGTRRDANKVSADGEDNNGSKVSQSKESKDSEDNKVGAESQDRKPKKTDKGDPFPTGGSGLAASSFRVPSYGRWDAEDNPWA